MRKRIKIERHALGSEDGEYVELTNDSILYLLDIEAVEIKRTIKNIEEFLYKYKTF